MQRSHTLKCGDVPTPRSRNRSATVRDVLVRMALAAAQDGHLGPIAVARRLCADHDCVKDYPAT